MTIHRRSLLTAAGLGLTASPVLAQAPWSEAVRAAAVTPERAPADPTETVRLWPGGAPGGENVTVVAQVNERSEDPAFHDRFAVYTTDPILTVFRPERPNGAALLLIPGGGYRWAVVDKEGYDCARVFAAAGVTCFVLRYRLPGDNWAAGPNAPLQDAQRAMRLIRAHAAQYGVDPDRIGALGASAGGHLAGTLAARHGDAVYEAVDAADAVSARPDLSILMYPVVTLTDPHAHAGSRSHLLGENPTADQIRNWSLETMPRRDTPPTFIVHAMDDGAVPPENAMMLTTALRAADVPVETHLFEEGGHGFGIRQIVGRPAAVWPELALAWGARRGWLG
ncbi:alpha/beta hydrolase [Brevundimonas sp.]|uniref:alpha/beta hydrolase n=1 Tax=Brevundimonas sp. TaxID=1871086 RepID=UPI001DE6E311|nr:alpha/beta hydrolase [Brevundimonas sp.]MBA3999983.1 alpha/beta hydrolase [Brevundimonas sp.]